jgi:hypothetical protein
VFDGFIANPSSAQIETASTTRVTVSTTAVTSTLPVLAPSGSATAPGFAFSAASNYGLYFSTLPAFSYASSFVGTWSTAGFGLAPSYQFYWHSSAAPTAGADTGLARSAAGVVKVTNGSTGDGTLLANLGIQGANSKALTDATATAFVRVAIAQAIATNYEAGKVEYTIYCDDDTNQAVQKGHVNFACHNLAGTESCGFGTPDGVTLGDGTASLSTPTFDATSGAADTIDLRVTSDCTGITPNTHTIQWRISTEATATLTPQ